ncbi:MAG: hypothetical protein ABSD74_18080 [Rhizomicrobium sp.]|jgi:hypothetical protein
MLQYLPGTSGLAEAVFVLLLFAAQTLVGAAVGRKNRWPALDPLAGWAVLCLPFVLLGTLTALSFIWVDVICITIVAASLAYCLWRGVAIRLTDWWPYLLLSAPFLLIVTPTAPYGWDQLSHWLPNVNYIYTVQHFPREGLPPTTSAHAGYPYGFALPVYWVEMAARACGTLFKGVGISAALNVTLFAICARMLVDALRSTQSGKQNGEHVTLGSMLFDTNIWLSAGLALLLMTALSPTFLPTNSISASADNPTSVVLLAITLSILPCEDGSNDRGSASLAQLALLLTLNVLLKEDNAVPALSLLLGRILWDARTGSEPLRTLRKFVLASMPMLAVGILWHAYAFLHIAQGEMAVRTPSQWHIALLPHVLLGMGGVFISKIGFLALLLATLFIASRSLSRRRPHDDRIGAIAVIAFAGLVGYTVFLAFAYISIFSEAEAERQAAFWRYQTHLGLVLEGAVIFAVCSSVVRPRTVYARLALPVAAVMVLAPVVFAPVIRPDLDPQSAAVRMVGNGVSPLIAGAAAIYIVDQTGSGAPCPMIVYESKTPVRMAGCVTKVSPCPGCMIQEAVARGEFIWTNGWSQELSQATGLHLAASQSHLLRRINGRWVAIAVWPKTPIKTRGVRTIWQSA